MAEIIMTNTGSMNSDINDMRGIMKKITREMAGMFDSVTELNSTWSGPAHTAFTQQFQADKENFKELCVALDAIIESIENAKAAYEKCEAEIGQEINRIQI